jgi:hypothetical protein
MRLPKNENTTIRYLDVGTGQTLKATIHTEPRLAPRFYVGENISNNENRFPAILFG